MPLFSRSRTLFILILLLLGYVPGVSARAPGDLPPIARWSDPATWDSQIPGPGDDVLIPDGQTIHLDVSPPPLGGLTIRGTLIFDEVDIDLALEWMLITGRLEIGTAVDPFQHTVNITLTDDRPGEEIGGMGDRVIAQMGGEIEIHGQPRVANWVQLGDTVQVGDSRVWLDQIVDWQVGDEIVLASTDFDLEQAETFTITAIDGQLVQIDRPARFMHWGLEQWYGNRLVDERAEVGLLSHNITISADESATESLFGGHIMSMGGRLFIENAALERMGQAGELARYPIHFHMKGDAATNDIVHQVSIRQSFNRCITIHGSNGVLLEGNVAFETIGHCYFMEDGAETGNELIGNLGLSTRAPAPEIRLLPSDDLPATYWITNPANDLLGNVAAGSDAFGFWYAFPEHPTGLSSSPESDATSWPRRTPLGAFRGNTAHSNGFRGLNVDDGPDLSGETTSTVYEPRVNPIPVGEYDDSPFVTAVFDSFTGYKNRERAIWLRGTDHVVHDAVLADNGIGATFASYDSYLDDSLVIGETDNIGTVLDPDEQTGAGGRSLPMPWDPSFRISGFEFYDGIVGVRNTQFGGFFPNATRRAHAIGFLRDNAFLLDPTSYATGLTFLDDSTRVFTATAHGGFDGDKMRVFQDLDGSVTGSPGAFVSANQPLLHDNSCRVEDEWNAFVCAGVFRSLTIENIDDVPISIGPIEIGQMGKQSVELVGIGGTYEYVPTEFSLNVRPNQRYQVVPDGSPTKLRVILSRAAPGEWVLVTLKWTQENAFVFDGYDPSAFGALPQVRSLEALAATNGDAWFRDRSAGTITIKLHIEEDDVDAARDICATWLCRELEPTANPAGHPF